MMRRAPLLAFAAFVLLTLIFFGVRLHALSIFPPFIDEAFHIHMAERILATASPLEMLGEGRQFTAWYYLLFQPFAADPIWIARAATVIASTLTFGAFLTLARQASGLHGMILTGLLLILSPFHLFFERLALADSIAASTTAVAIAIAYRLRRRLSTLDAVFVGVCVFLAFGAKVNALVFYGIPIAAVLTLPARGVRWRPRLVWALIALGISLGLLALFAFVAYSRGLGFYDGLITRGVASGGGISSAAARLLNSTAWASEWLIVYFGIIPFALLICACGVFVVRREFYLLLVLFAPVAAILLSERQDTRFWITPVALLLTIGGITLAKSSTRPPARILAYGGVALFAAIVWLPFASASWQNALEIPLAQTDFRQYLMADGAGTGFERAFDALDAQTGVTSVIGILPNCQAFRYMGLARRFEPEIICPPTRSDGQDRDALIQLMQSSQNAGVYVLLDDVPYLPATAPGQLIETIRVQTRGLQRPMLRLFDRSP